MSIVLHYFDVYGRGEIIRLILTHYGQVFTDHRVQYEEWPELCASNFSEFGQLPVLEIDGLRLVETKSITRYICQKFGSYPDNITDVYWVESLSDLRDDIINALADVVKKNDLNEIVRVYTEDIPWWLAKIEARLVRNQGGDGWFVGNSLTRADFEIFLLIWDGMLREGLKERFGGIIKKFPKLDAFVERFLENSPRVKSYLESRPVRSY